MSRIASVFAKGKAFIPYITAGDPDMATTLSVLKALAKKLKQECSTGGTIKDDVIEIQGEQREKIADVLHKLGYKVKIAGG